MISLNNYKITPTIFPDKTSQVWKIPEETITSNQYDIYWKFESEAEVMHLYQLKYLLDAIHRNTSLYIRYLPYGRQDKDVTNNSTFALRVFIKILRSMNFKSITVFDPHSFLIADENVTIILPAAEVRSIMAKHDFEALCYPDKGAHDKYSPVFSEYKFVTCKKLRDPETGEITSLAFGSNSDIKGKKFLIVDDICDGGATFIRVAKLLFEYGARDVGLYISHGIFSKGLKVLLDAGISKIFTKEGQII